MRVSKSHIHSCMENVHTNFDVNTQYKPDAIKLLTIPNMKFFICS